MSQGDGTAAIFGAEPSVFTFSVHCAAQSFPEPLHASDLDIALPAGTGDEAYMQARTVMINLKDFAAGSYMSLTGCLR